MINKLIIIVLFSGSTIAFGQACCTAGTPLLGSLEMSTASVGAWHLGISYEYNFLSDVYSGSSFLDDQTRKRRTQSILTEINYGLFKNITITTLFSIVRQSRDINPISGTTNSLDITGIGDALLLVKYNLISMNIIKQRELALGAGIKAPLGRSSLSSRGILLPADMQPGTGSWDYVLWGYYSEGFIPVLPINIFLNFSYKLNGTNKRFGAGQEGYKFGNEFIAAAGLGFRTDLFFDFTLLFRFRNTQADEFATINIPNTGGDWLYVVPGVNIKLSENLTARLTGQLPFYRNLSGTQLTTTFSSSISFLYSLDNLVEFTDF